MPNPHNLKPGQTVYYRSMYGTRDREVVIKKIGRKFAELDWARATRLNLETMRGDIPGFSSSHGRFWLSQADWELERETEKALDNFKAAVARLRVGNVTLEQIEQARRLLGLEEKEQQ